MGNQKDDHNGGLENGRPGTTKPHILSSEAYLTEIVPFSKHSGLENEIVLRQKYLESGLTVKELSVLFGCGPTTIKKQLRRFGITKTTPGSRCHRANLRFGQKLVSGKIKGHKSEMNTKKAILTMYSEEGLSPTAIARLLTQMKIPTKKRGKGWDHSVIIDILTREGVYSPSRKTKETV